MVSAQLNFIKRICLTARKTKKFIARHADSPRRKSARSSSWSHNIRQPTSQHEAPEIHVCPHIYRKTKQKKKTNAKEMSKIFNNQIHFLKIVNSFTTAVAAAKTTHNCYY